MVLVIASKLPLECRSTIISGYAVPAFDTMPTGSKKASCRITTLSRQIDDVIADEVSTNGQRRISCAGQGALSRRALEPTFAADNGEGSDEAGLFE
jgi:hypothetical protein